MVPFAMEVVLSFYSMRSMSRINLISFDASSYDFLQTKSSPSTLNSLFLAQPARSVSVFLCQWSSSQILVNHSFQLFDPFSFIAQFNLTGFIDFPIFYERNFTYFLFCNIV